jgi:hypothetical protein
MLAISAGKKQPIHPTSDYQKPSYLVELLWLNTSRQKHSLLVSGNSFAITPDTQQSNQFQIAIVSNSDSSLSIRPDTPGACSPMNHTTDAGDSRHIGATGWTYSLWEGG